LAIPGIFFWQQPFMGLSQNFFTLTTLFHIALFYFNAYYLYPKLLTRRWWWLYILVMIAIMVLSFHLKVWLLQLSSDIRLTDIHKRIIFFPVIPFVAASILFRLISDRLRFERLEKEANAQRLTAELKFLRSQVSPHFLFNTLTNMVSLARQKSDTLEPSLIKLADLLRYMIYDSSTGKMPIKEEIENLQNYIALQQMRFGEDVKLDLDIRLDHTQDLIEPMLLVPFIENAYKHGIGLVKNPTIDVQINLKDHILQCYISNTYNPSIEQSKDKVSGIGIANVRNRLNLLYPDKHSLSISNEENKFIVQLKLQLT
jgi:two-component system LytT family sensor kinase